MLSQKAGDRIDGQQGTDATFGIEDVKEPASVSNCISSLYQFPMEAPDICSRTEDSDDDVFKHYWEHVDMSQLSWEVRSCTDGYSEGMLAVLSEEEMRDILLYDEATGIEFQHSSGSPDWLVVSPDIGVLQRSLKWAQRALKHEDDFFLSIIVDEQSSIPHAEIISYWAETGIPPENISVSCVDTDTVSAEEMPWGECLLYVDDYNATWLYWCWRGQKDQLARRAGDSNAWRLSCSLLDEMINDEALLYDFDPWC